MTFTQVCSKWMKEMFPLWDHLEAIDKWCIAAVIASILLLTISFWQVL